MSQQQQQQQYHQRYSRKRTPEVYGAFIPSSAPILLEVVLRDGEDFEHFLRRFLKKWKKQKLGAEINEHQYYEKPSVTRRLAREHRRRVDQKITQANCPQD